jgi:membrane fusion protein (multidrug efflux system)
MTKSINTLLIIIGAAGIITSCNNAPAADNKSISKSEKVTIETIMLKKDTLIKDMTIPGELLAYQQVDLYAKVTGFVKELKVDIGSKVKEGQLLMTLEAPEMMSQLSAAQSRLKAQEAAYLASLASYNRLVQTSKTPGTISPNDLEQAEAKRNSDLANLEAARASFKEVNDIKNYLLIRAPFDGTITARNVNVGAYVGPSGRGSELPVLVLQQQDRLRLVISVPETYSSNFTKGDEVSFKVRSYPSQNFVGKLTRLSGALDTRLRAQRAEADIDNKNGRLLPGTVADVNVTLRSSPNSFIVPKSAVVNSAEGVYVIKVGNGIAHRVAVTNGIDSNGLVEVAGALAENDQLLKKGSDEIKDGQGIK